MRKSQYLKWSGLFALIPLTLVLIVLDNQAPFSATWHYVLLAAIVVLVCVLALRWAERHSGLLEGEGADSLISYRPLPGTVEAMGAGPAALEPFRTGRRRFIPGYDPMAASLAAGAGSDEAHEELSE